MVHCGCNVGKYKLFSIVIFIICAILSIIHVLDV